MVVSGFVVVVEVELTGNTEVVVVPLVFEVGIGVVVVERSAVVVCVVTVVALVVVVDRRPSVVVMLDMVPSDVIDISVVVTFEDIVVARSGKPNVEEIGTNSSRVSIIFVSTLL